MPIAKDFVFFGRLCLDFAHTGDMGYGSWFERLTSPRELQRWLSLSLVNLPKLGIRVEDLQRAKALRKAIWSIANAVLEHRIPEAGDVRLLNAIACEPGLVQETGFNRQMGPLALSDCGSGTGDHCPRRCCAL